MKRIVFLVFMAACLFRCTNLHDKELESAWKELKEKCLRKGNESKRIVSLFVGSKHVSKDLALNTLVWANRLRVSAQDEYELDSRNFYYLRKSNDSLDRYMPLFFEAIFDNPDSLVRTTYAAFLEDYLKAARGVSLAKIRFAAAVKPGSPYTFK